MEKHSRETRQTYVTPALRIRPIDMERCFLASATIPEFNETEEDW